MNQLTTVDFGLIMYLFGIVSGLCMATLIYFAWRIDKPN